MLARLKHLLSCFLFVREMLDVDTKQDREDLEYTMELQCGGLKIFKFIVQCCVVFVSNVIAVAWHMFTIFRTWNTGILDDLDHLDGAYLDRIDYEAVSITNF